LCDNLSIGNIALLYDCVRLHFVIHCFYLTCWCELNSIEPSGDLKLLIYSDWLLWINTNYDLCSMFYWIVK